mgnify:CR=1 FL=1
MTSFTINEAQMKKNRLFLLLAIVLVIINSFSACYNAGSWLVKEEEPEHADAIVVLMGSLFDSV